MSDIRRALAFDNIGDSENTFYFNTTTVDARPTGPIWSTPKRGIIFAIRDLNLFLGGDENTPPNFQFSIINSNNCSPTRSTYSAITKKSSANLTKRIFGAIRNKSFLYFGFVPIGDSHLIDQKLTNHSGESLRIKCKLKSNVNSTFQNVSSEYIPPNGEFIITIRYTPQALHEDNNILIVDRTNGTPARYSFKLNGYGGRSKIQMVKSVFQNTTPSGLIILTPDFFPPVPSPLPRFFFDLENIGDRSAFVSIMAVNKDDESISDDAVYINPQKFVLSHSNWKQSFANENFIIHNQDFTENFLGEEKAPMEQLVTSNESENVEFNNSLRVIHVNVLNNTVFKLSPALLNSLPARY